MNYLKATTWVSMPPDYILSQRWCIEPIVIDASGNTVNKDGKFGGFNFKLGGNFVGDIFPSLGVGFDDYIESVTIPQHSLEYGKSDWGMLNIESHTPPNEFTITFCDDVKGHFLYLVKEWMDAIFDVKGNCVQTNWRSQYVNFKASLLDMSNRSGFFTTIVSYTLWHCYPKGLSEISLSHGDSDRKEFDLECVCESIEQSSAPVGIYNKTEINS